MKTVGIPFRLSHKFSTAYQLLLATATLHYEAASYSQILDKWPDIKTLKKIHTKITLDPNLCSSISFGIKLMRAYAACGQTKVTSQIFDKIRERNVVIFNVMIRSYVNNQLYHDAFFLFKSMNSSNTSPDYYTFPCVLKACSASADLRVGLQVHAQVLKMNLDANLYVGNGLIAMYGKCGSLRDARSILDEMPRRNVVSWNSMVAVYAQNGGFNDALEVCKDIQSVGLEPNAGTMASLLPAVSNTSAENVAFVEDMFMKVRGEELVPWNVMIAMYVNNSMPNKAVELYTEMEDRGIEAELFLVFSQLVGIFQP
ncbi:hypothetical protein ACH5RR_041589 [Cinchona calisaya]|uniref:Pentatricopeptide repeat-containing protein n=1 Tax=Cinchona calisaya TaxID=153742 RepID=A0ABD2XZ89_9GENT